MGIVEVSRMKAKIVLMLTLFVCTLWGSAQAQSISILEPAEGATIWGNIINARWISDEVDIQPADGQHTPGVGHYHLFLFSRREAKLDLKTGEPIGNSDRIIHTTEAEYLFENILPGPYTLYVVLADGQHIPDDSPVLSVVHLRVAPVEAGSTVGETPWWVIALVVGGIVGAALLVSRS